MKGVTLARSSSEPEDTITTVARQNMSSANRQDRQTAGMWRCGEPTVSPEPSSLSYQAPSPYIPLLTLVSQSSILDLVDRLVFFPGRGGGVTFTPRQEWTT